MSTDGWQIFVEVPGKAPIELEAGEAVIGRSRACAVQIAETTVSRQHAVFVVEPGKVRLKDLGSSNGTYVNGKRVEGSLPLSDGDRVVIGEAELVIRILAPLSPTEATQRLTLPPLSQKSAAPGAAGAPVAPASSVSATEPPVNFRRTPTEVPGVPEPPAPAAPAPPPPRAPVVPPPPPAALAGEPPPAPAVMVKAGVPEARKGGELLPSIREIDAVPVAPPAVRTVPPVENVYPAGFWIRVAATLLDSIPVFVLAAIGLALAFFDAPVAGLFVNLLVFAYGLLLALVLPALKGTTPGKKLLKLAIVSEKSAAGQGLGWGTAFLRLVGHLVCSMTFSLGYLLVAFTAEKQGLHDLIAKTHVVRRR